MPTHVKVPNQASDLPFYNIFAPQKVPLSKICDDVIACDLWFAPPTQSKILTTPMITELSRGARSQQAVFIIRSQRFFNCCFEKDEKCKIFYFL